MNTQPALPFDFLEMDTPCQPLYFWRLGKIDGMGTVQTILEAFHPERHGGQWMVETSTGLIVLEIREVESRGDVK